MGIGGTFERAAQLAKKATFRPIDTCHPDERYAAMERELLTAINQMGFGPAGCRQHLLPRRKAREHGHLIMRNS